MTKWAARLSVPHGTRELAVWEAPSRRHAFDWITRVAEHIDAEIVTFCSANWLSESSEEIEEATHVAEQLQHINLFAP